MGVGGELENDVASPSATRRGRFGGLSWRRVEEIIEQRIDISSCVFRALTPHDLRDVPAFIDRSRRPAKVVFCVRVRAGKNQEFS